MKKIISIILLLEIFLNRNISYSQTTQLTKDLFTKIDLGKSEFLNGVIGKDGDNYIIDKQGTGLNFLSGVYSLIKINELGEQSASVVLKTEIDGEKFISKKVINFGGKTLMIGTASKKGVNNQIYLYEIDLKTLGFTGTPLKVCNYNEGYKYATMTSYLPEESAENFNLRDISFAVSPDQKMIGFITKSEFGNAEKEKHHIAVFDSNLKKVYEKDVTLPYADNVFVDDKILIDSNGNIVLQGHHPKTFDKFLITFSDNGAKVSSIKIPVIDGSSVSTMTANGKVLFTFIAKDGKSLSAIVFNAVDNSIEKTETKSDVTEVLKFICGSKYTATSTLAPFSVEEILPRENGGYYVICQEHYYQNMPNNEPSMIGTSNLLVYSISGEDFSIDWMKAIKKDELVNPSFYAIGSYASLIYHDDLILYYNDDSRNISDFTASYRFTPAFKACVTKTTVSSAGEIKKEELVTDKENLAVRNDVVQLVDGNKVFMCMKMQGGSDMLGIVPIK